LLSFCILAPEKKKLSANKQIEKTGFMGICSDAMFFKTKLVDETTNLFQADPLAFLRV